MNQKLEAIAEKAGADLIALIKDGETKILEAWDACAEEAQDNETKPKFKLTLGITLDLDADAMETALSWGIKHKLSVNSSIPDPNQPDLIPKGVSSVTISSGDKSVTIDADGINGAAARLRRKSSQN